MLGPATSLLPETAQVTGQPAPDPFLDSDVQALEIFVKNIRHLALEQNQVVLFDTKSRVLAVWPATTPVTESLVAAAGLAVRSGEPMVATTNCRQSTVALPLNAGRDTRGAVTISTHADKLKQASVMLALNAAANWLSALLQTMTQSVGSDDAVLRAVQRFHQGSHFKEQAHQLMDYLADQYNCQRVSLVTIERRRRAKVVAISGTKSYTRHTPLNSRLCQAVSMALSSTATPTQSEFSTIKLDDELQFAVQPIKFDDRWLGALVFEHAAPAAFIDDAQATIARLCTLLAPMITQAQAAQRDPLAVLNRALKRLLPRCDFKTRKTWAGSMLVGALAVFLLIPTTYEVATIAEVEGQQQRMLVAPMDTYIDAVHARAGDVVSAGALLAGFSADDLILEQVKWASERARAVAAQRDAAARQDRAKLRVLEAQLSHIDAELKLVAQQVGRHQLIAPIDGVVVSGDLGQRLGAPVKRGETLFEIVPQGEFRLRLLVAERDINDVRAGQRGMLKLNAYPGQRFDLVVERVTPRNEATPSGNRFIAYAELEHSEIDLRPGMAGVVRIEAGQRARLDSWTAELRAWISLQWWRWFG